MGQCRVTAEMVMPGHSYGDVMGGIAWTIGRFFSITRRRCWFPIVPDNPMVMDDMYLYCDYILFKHSVVWRCICFTCFFIHECLQIVSVCLQITRTQICSRKWIYYTLTSDFYVNFTKKLVFLKLLYHLVSLKQQHVWFFLHFLYSFDHLIIFSYFQLIFLLM